MPKKKKKIEARLSEIHGNGVFATEAIRKGERIVRYKGKLRTHEEVDQAYGDDDEDGHTFLFTLNDDYVIDANVDGNIARWINHSCEPNCEANEIEGRVFIHALRDLEPGEELFYDYQLVVDERYTAKLKRQYLCLCGAPTCRGTMLAPKR